MSETESAVAKAFGTDFLTIVQWPHAALKAVALPVANFDSDIEAIAARMIELMDAERGLGLSANQVGIPIRLFVTRAPADARRSRVFINPKIVEQSEECVSAKEGCLSWPGREVFVRRHKHVRMRYQDFKGKWHEEGASGLTARCWQHEIDHLDGVNLANPRGGGA